MIKKKLKEATSDGHSGSYTLPLQSGLRDFDKTQLKPFNIPVSKFDDALLNYDSMDGSLDVPKKTAKKMEKRADKITKWKKGHPHLSDDDGDIINPNDKYVNEWLEIKPNTKIRKNKTIVVSEKSFINIIKSLIQEQQNNKMYDPLNDPKRHKNDPPRRIMERCIAISPEECKTNVFSNKETKIGTSSTNEGCSEYAIKCLSQYDKDIPHGNAWRLSFNMQQYPSKYDMFQSEIDWNKIYKLIKDRKITKTSCSNYIDANHADETYPQMRNLIKQFYPSSSKFNPNILELGDIVGIYWKNSSNMGRAFCERAVKDRKLDDRGNIERDYFSFNTHVGFVGAIKDNVPIIFHNVNGTYLSTPVNLLQNNGMITWVKTDPSIKNTILQQEKNR